MVLQMLKPEEFLSAYELWREAETKFGERDYIRTAQLLEVLLTRDETAEMGRQVRELLARSYYHSAQVKKAVAATREALERDPDNGYLVLLLSRSLERNGQRDEAATYRRMADALGVSG